MQHEDFGTKIGGARKDIRGQFNASDVAGMTHIERTKLVRKDAVWPTPDYAALVGEKGYTRNAAAMIKMIRDCMPPAPLVSEGIDPESYAAACASYVRVLNIVKPVAEQKTEADIARFVSTNEDFRSQIAQSYTNEFHQPGFKLMGELASWRSAMLRMSYSMSDGIRRTLYAASVGKLDFDVEKMIRKNPAWPEGTSRAEGIIRKKRLSFVPSPTGSGFVLATYNRAIPESNFEYYRRHDEYGDVLGKSYENLEVANAALIAAIEGFFSAKRKATVAKKEAIFGKRGSSKEAVRIGPAVRDRSSTGNDYLEQFNMRGGEFGEWVKPAERQQVLDKGFDGFADMAEALEIEKGQLSIEGSLAIAFGARGNGSATGAAHYEPGRRVINLTKPHGSGSLAHEWSHFFDHKCGDTAKEIGLPVNNSGGAYWLSNSKLAEKDLANVAPQNLEKARLLIRINAEMNNIWTSSSPETRAEYLKTLKDRDAANIENAKKESIPTILTDIRSTLKYVKAPEDTIEQAITKANAVLNSLLTEESLSNSSSVKANALLELREIIGRKGRLGYISERIEAMLQPIENNRMRHRFCSDPKHPLPPSVSATAYKKACDKVDKEMGKSVPYFSTNIEMFARALESAIFDELALKNRHNEFLVSEVHSPAHPAGEDREKLRKALLPIVAEMCRLFPMPEKKRQVEMSPEPTPVEMSAPDMTSLPRSPQREEQSDMFVSFSAAPSSGPTIDI